MHRPGIILALLLASMLIPAVKAVAHPLGNFSINQYSALHINKDEIQIRYVVDMAEIPTFQEIQATGLVPKVSNAGESYLPGKVESLSEGLSLEVNGRKIALRIESREILFPGGAGGLPTMKIGVVFKGKVDVPRTAAYELFYRDGNFSGRPGWKEIVATAENGTELIDSSVSTADRSAQLSNYPTDLLNNPPQVLEVRLIFAPSAAVAASKTTLPAALSIRQSITDHKSNIAELATTNFSAGAPQQVGKPSDSRRRATT